MDLVGKNAAITRGRPVERGNAGRPKGARNKTALALEALREGEGEALTRKAVEMVLAGDTTALRVCMDRPQDRGQPRDEGTQGGPQRADESPIDRRLCAPRPALCRRTHPTA